MWLQYQIKTIIIERFSMSVNETTIHCKPTEINVTNSVTI